MPVLVVGGEQLELLRGGVEPHLKRRRRRLLISFLLLLLVALFLWRCSRT